MSVDLDAIQAQMTKVRTSIANVQRPKQNQAQLEAARRFMVFRNGDLGDLQRELQEQIDTSREWLETHQDHPRFRELEDTYLDWIALAEDIQELQDQVIDVHNESFPNNDLNGRKLQEYLARCAHS